MKLGCKICIGLTIALLINLSTNFNNIYAAQGGASFSPNYSIKFIENYIPTLDELNQKGLINPATGEIYPDSAYLINDYKIIELKNYNYGYTNVADNKKDILMEFFNKNAVYSIDNSKLAPDKINNSGILGIINNDFLILILEKMAEQYIITATAQ